MKQGLSDSAHIGSVDQLAHDKNRTALHLVRPASHEVETKKRCQFISDKRGNQGNTGYTGATGDTGAAGARGGGTVVVVPAQR